MKNKNASKAEVQRERNRAAQEAYRERQASAGRKPRVKYLTADENKAVDAFIEELRQHEEEAMS